MLRKPLYIVSGLIILTSIAAGIHFLDSPSFSSCQNEENSCKNSNSLFVDKKTQTNIESPQLSFVQENSLTGISCSQIFSSKELEVLGSLSGSDTSGDKKEITEHIVQNGDTLISIATDFDISLNTLLWANGLTRTSIIKPGQTLVVLPVSGVVHHVKKGDTIGGIAQTYKGKVSEIIAFNELPEEGDIFIGDILVIPNGTQPAPSYSPSNYSQVPLASSYFIVPVVSPYRTTQWLHWYNAVDFANQGSSCGQPVLAAAGGQVLKISYGYNQGAGNYIRIIHPNGLITHYGHLQKVFVTLGQNVSQGEIIGLIGYSGRTIPAGPSGCHLHFAVYSSEGNPPRNPFSR